MQHITAVQWSVVCEVLASPIMAHTVDSVNYRSKSSEYLKLASELEQQYRDHLGIKDGESEIVAGSTMVDVDRRSSVNQDLLTHPNRWR